MADAVEGLPVYKQIRRCIAERIERGDYPTGSMIPSENELAEEFGTTRLTIRSAMDELVKSGQIRRVQGKGAFVGHKWFDEHVRKGGFRQTVLASGATPSVRILARSKRYAGPYYADLFGIAEDDLLYSVRRLNCIDGEPVSIEMTLIPCLLFPGIEDVDISVFSLYETYDMLGRKPDKSIEKLDIEALGARDASLLDLEAGDLALVLECLTYDASGQVIEYAKSFTRGDAGGYTYNYVYEAGKKMTALADRVHEEGYDAVFLMGVGGTWDEFMQLEYLMNKFGDRDLEVYLIHAAEWNVMGHKRMTDKSVVLTASESGTTPEVLEAVGKMREMGVRVFAMTNPEGKIGQAVGAENCVMMASDHGAGGCEKGYYLADCFGLRLLNRRGCFPKFDLFIEQTKDVWKDMLDIRKRFEPRAEELARKYALADYTMFIGSGALWGETILYSMCLLEEMQWKRIRHITSHDFFHGTLELLEPGVPVFLFMGEDECRALDERVRAFLTSGVTGDEDYVIIDTAEYAIPGLDDDFRVIVSPWILSALTTDRLARNYELVTKHNLKYRRYYHQFDY